MYYDKLQEIHEEMKLSTYYKRLETNSFQGVLNNPKKYIKDYLAQGDKLPEELRSNFDSIITDDRSYHTFSIYFMGLFIYSNCDNFKIHVDDYLSSINKKILSKSKIPNKLWNPASFEYYWFLICFFHDLALESSKTERNNMITYFGMKDNKSIQDKIETIIKTLPQSDVVPELLMNLFLHYYKYRLNGNNELLDHGLMGGAYHFYDRKKQLNYKLKHCHNVEKFGPSELIDNNTDLIWSKYLLDYVHRDVAWIIATHNIWFLKDGDCEPVGFMEELKSLIISEPIYSSSSHSLFFLLSLVDMMDLYKFFNKDNLEFQLNYILQNSLIETSDDSITISFNNELEIYQNEYYEKLLAECYRLPYIVSKVKNKIKISFV